MSEHKKNRLDLIEEKLGELNQTSWARRLRITSGVLWNLLIVFLIFGLTFTVFAASVGAGYFASLVSKEPLRPKEEMRQAIFNYEETSEIYTNGQYLRKVSADIERKETRLEDVSQYVIDAVMATEDEYFNQHKGIVPKAVFRGLFQDVTNSDSQTGGSTLTQQLIKNQILTNEVSYERKAKELLLAMRLEHFMEKDEILEAYLNIIPYGRNANGTNIAGIEAAAEGIFDKSAKDLTLPQAAYIAGIPQAPFAYTPFYNRNRGLKEPEYLQPGINRMKTVLFRMKETGYITDAQYEEAVAYDITKDFKEPSIPSSEHYPYLTEEIQRRTVQILSKMIAEEDGVDPDRLENEKKLNEKYTIMAERSMRNDGFRIYATVDLELYDALNEVAQNYDRYGYTYTDEKKNSETGEVEIVKYPVQVGAMMIENNTGRILAFVGGRDHNEEEVNHATQSFRQNGSTMKPLAVFAPAIEYGVIGAGSPVVDVKFNWSGWKPVNFLANQELGIIPARQALASSQNLATARLYRQILDRRPAEFLEKMGFSKLQEDDYENASFSLGAMGIGASVEENTNAFATFANGGKFVDSYLIEKIEDREGNIIFEHKSEAVDVFSPQTAYIITDMLRDVPKYGTATNMRNHLNFNIDMAAKTGTTDSYSDSWLVGYNPNISLGVWMGYKYQTLSLQGPGNRSYGTSNIRTTTLFAQLMNAANKVKPDVIGAGARFQQPEGVVSRSFCGISGLAPSAACSSAGLVRSDLFNARVMLPNKADDSIISSSSVLINGKRYQALPSTPREFITAGGVGVNSEFIERMLGPLKGDASKLFPANSGFASQVVSGAVFHADDVPPAPVSVSNNGGTLQWSNSPSNDVVGYYIYRDGKRVGAISSASRSYPIGGGSYYVVAVDITGKQSGPSNVVSAEGGETDETETPEPTDGDQSNGANPDAPPSDQGNESNNGNGNSEGNGNNGSNGNNSNANGNNSGNGNGTPPVSN
ncbi:transglycosylase domain-containing protein [Sporosarcina sp. FSL W7-1349]|uniref:transglycosylase domain-containing protein n=1 Tax=Sporosarcina sp. FSL W7-1349 TaxID=2921561 RepID=UPI0030FA6D9F